MRYEGMEEKKNGQTVKIRDSIYTGTIAPSSVHVPKGRAHT